MIPRFAYMLMRVDLLFALSAGLLGVGGRRPVTHEQVEWLARKDSGGRGRM